jgi:hypothetical protein
VIVAVVAAVTGTVVTVNVAVAVPAATVTLAGVVALALLLDSVTVIPAAGARPVKVTVPVEEKPPVTAVGFMVTLLRAAGLTVRVAVRVALYVPVIVAGVDELTALVVTEKVAVVAPAATVTLAGTTATALLLESVTVAPPTGAMLPSVTVPVEELPPATVAGLRVKFESTGGLMASVAVRVPL